MMSLSLIIPSALKRKISVFIFDIASSNMFYGDVYADLYVDFTEESSIFKEILHNHFCVFKKTIDNINPVDSNNDLLLGSFSTKLFRYKEK